MGAQTAKVLSGTDSASRQLLSLGCLTANKPITPTPGRRGRRCGYSRESHGRPTAGDATTPARRSGPAATSSRVEFRCAPCTKHRLEWLVIDGIDTTTRYRVDRRPLPWSLPGRELAGIAERTPTRGRRETGHPRQCSPRWGTSTTGFVTDGRTRPFTIIWMRVFSGELSDEDLR